MAKDFSTSKSVSKYPGPRNWLRRWFPKLFMGSAKSAELKHGLGNPFTNCAAEPPQLMLGEPTTSARTAVVVAGVVLPNRNPCRVAVALLLQIEYGNPVCLKIVPENVQPFTSAFGPHFVR